MMSSKAICRRIAQLRLELAGPRGKASFAKNLKLSPSTYDYYESSRVPPADVLVRIAEQAGVDLYWLLTGRQQGEVTISSAHPVVQRAAKLLADYPDSAEPLAAFIELLAAAAGFPAKGEKEQLIPGKAAGLQEKIATAQAVSEDVAKDARSTKVASQAGEWIPILGRSAAGVACFWNEAKEGQGVTKLEDLIRQSIAGQGSFQISTARSEGEDMESPVVVEIITLRQVRAGQVAEFVSIPSIKRHYGDAFALRIDGDSMAPEIRHGDIVVVSPSCPAVDGRCAVVQLANQIGVTCKLYRREGQAVHLVPINEHFTPASYPAGQVEWAFCVLARVRP